MKEPRYTIHLDNLTIDDVLQIAWACTWDCGEFNKPTKEIQSRVKKLKESIWDEHQKWVKANRKCAQHMIL